MVAHIIRFLSECFACDLAASIPAAYRVMGAPNIEAMDRLAPSTDVQRARH
jgi:hypothetical protein